MRRYLDRKKHTKKTPPQEVFGRLGYIKLDNYVLVHGPIRAQIVENRQLYGSQVIDEFDFLDLEQHQLQPAALALSQRARRTEAPDIKQDRGCQCVRNVVNLYP